MIAAGQRHVGRLVSRVRDANTEVATHSTRTQGIVSFHVHEHGNGRNVTKCCDNISMEGEETAREGIICRHADRKLKQFSHEWKDERVRVPWLIRTGYDPNTENVVLLEALVWGEIVIKDKEDPRGMLPPFEWSEAICGEAECNITMIREVIMG